MDIGRMTARVFGVALVLCGAVAGAIGAATSSGLSGDQLLYGAWDSGCMNKNCYVQRDATQDGQLFARVIVAQKLAGATAYKSSGGNEYVEIVTGAKLLRARMTSISLTTKSDRKTKPDSCSVCEAGRDCAQVCFFSPSKTFLGKMLSAKSLLINLAAGTQTNNLEFDLTGYADAHSQWAPTAAQQSILPWHIASYHPAAMRAWHAVVPKRFRRVDWIYDFGGTASEVKSVTVSGRAYLLGTVCKPHDCGDNQVAFLLAEDGSQAAGFIEIWSGNRRIGQWILGRPRDAEIGLLRQEIGRYH